MQAPQSLASPNAVNPDLSLSSVRRHEGLIATARRTMIGQQVQLRLVGLQHLQNHDRPTMRARNLSILDAHACRRWMSILHWTFSTWKSTTHDATDSTLTTSF